ncbi:type II secretion system minor pseudopilin GspI [Acinetobacter sp. ANC 5378]|nr:type II secretion system minor pseudopilin GspI [Acinetobacter sp. ANC 5378]
MKAKYSRHSASSCTAVKQRFMHRCSSSTAFGLSCEVIPLRSSITRLNLVHSEHSSSSCARTKRYFVYPRSGFTLLEVMVALAIFATAAIAFTKVAMQYTQATSNAILRTKAQFVALNEVAVMEINQEWLQGTQSKQISQQGETWQIDKSAQSTISPNVQRIEVQVSLFNAESGKVESGITNLVFFNYKAKV